MKGVSLGIVGLGDFGSQFAPLFAAHPLVDRIALCDREADRIAPYLENALFRRKLRSTDVFGSFDDILRADLDALALFTQPWLHAGQAISALEAGKHVYSAVPVVMLPASDEILDWCDRLVAACGKTGLSYMLGETTYYRPATMYCRRRAAEGGFGDFTYAEGQYFHDVKGLYDVYTARRASQAGREWVEKEKQYAAGGVLGGPMHYPTHSTSGPISIMKAHMVKVAAWGGLSPDPVDHELTGDRFINETALFKMSNGATTRICEHRKTGHTGTESFAIYGTRACFSANPWYTGNTWIERGADPVMRDVQTGEMREHLPPEVLAGMREAVVAALELERARGKDAAPLSPEDIDKRAYGGHGGSHAYLVHEFVDALTSSRQPAINAWEAVRYMAPGAVAHKSAERDGESLEIPDWGDAP